MGVNKSFTFSKKSRLVIFQHSLVGLDTWIWSENKSRASTLSQFDLPKIVGKNKEFFSWVLYSQFWGHVERLSLVQGLKVEAANTYNF